MAINLIKALRTVDRSFHIEEVVANNGERRIVAHAGDEQGVRIIQEIASLYRHKVHPTEVASSGSVILVEKAADEDPEQDEDLVGDDFEDDEDDSYDDDGDEDEEDGEDGDDRLSDLGGGDGNLRYLNTAEGHKFALRVFTSMLGNEDMSRYAQFLIDLDRLFGGYVNKEGADFGTRKKKIEEAMVEVANEMQAEEDAVIEEARKKGKKKGRAGLLSALMKAISGDTGEAIAAAWDKGDSSKVKEGLNEAINEVVGKMPQAEPKTDEEATSEEDKAA